MSLAKNLPVESLLQVGLEEKVKSQVIKKLVDKHLENARRELTQTLEEALVGFSIDSIGHFRDLAEQCDKYEIRAFLNEEELVNARKE